MRKELKIEGEKERPTAENLDDPYYKRVPLPRIPGYREMDKAARIAQFVNMVHKVHWQEVIQPNSTLLSGNIASSTKYDYYAHPRRLHNPYRTQ